MIWPYIGSLVGACRDKTLPVVEMPLQVVRGKRLPNLACWAHTVVNRPALEFRGIQLAHAVVKADFLEYTNPLMPGIGFVVQSHRVVDWNSPSFGLRPGGVHLLSDFVETSLAGRIGQGLAILHAHQNGFAFAGHLREYLRATGVCITGQNGDLLPVADFVMEASNGDRCLVEAKATFHYKNNCPKRAKQRLRAALEQQIDRWVNKLSPPATKSYAVCSFLRDHTQAGADPSVLAFVDPEGGPGPEEELAPGSIALPPLRLKRENYSAWLAAMGLPDAAERLRTGSSEGATETPFAVIGLDDLEIAIRWPWGQPMGAMWQSSWHGPLHSPSQMPLTPGIEVGTLATISAAILGNGGALDELQALETPGVVSDSETHDYSVFPDKTFLGTLAPEPNARTERFTL